MGELVLEKLASESTVGKLTVCDASVLARRRLKRTFPRAVVTDDLSSLENADVTVLAVKPQDFRTLTLKAGRASLVISIMAGVSMSVIRQHTGARHIVRAMPNTPAQLGLGFTAWTGTTGVSGAQRAFAQRLFARMGEELYVRSEALIDKFTAVSGSGPAYFTYAALSLLNAARALGIPEKDAERAVRKTLEGTAALLTSSSDLAERISQVASKGGTTEAALRVFRKSKFESIWARAVRAAHKRAVELSKEK